MFLIIFHRVATLSYKIALKCNELNQEEYNCGNPNIAYVGGLIHDVLDTKLITTEYNADTIESELRALLFNEGFNATEVDNLIIVTKSVGYSKLLKNSYETKKHLFPLEYKAVQDADLLDAIGCIGVARCFSYGGKKNRKLFGVSDIVCQDLMSYELYTSKTDESYPVSVITGSDSSNTNTTTNASNVRTNASTEHFFEKLLRINSMLITPYGKELGIQRHANMIQYLTLLQEELPESYNMQVYIDKFK